MQVEIVAPRKFALVALAFFLTTLITLTISRWWAVGTARASAASFAGQQDATPTIAPLPTMTPLPTATPTPVPLLIPAAGGKIFACRVPAEFGVVTSKYGEPRGDNVVHRGIDYACPRDLKDVRVLSPMNGHVSFVGDLGDLGNAIIIENGGWRVILGHLAFWGVSEGQDVKPGDVVGICGSTGNSSGPHVHMEIQVWNDPWYWQTVPPQNLPGAEACEWESLKQLP
ncbi:MAG: M23 family metallopeptidase [Chloroflexota bacterium]|jgi:murein DD-endopeptidase MepM/ murein hydrolase activator NlpD